jgi:parallel beta-helix repeat protein
MKRVSWLPITCLFLLISTRSLLAAEILVPTDYPTIQAAINAAQRGDVVKVAQETYRENLVMKEGVTLQGGYSSDFLERDISLYVTIIDGGQNDTVVLFVDISSASIDGFTVTNGYSACGGGIVCDYSHPIITNNTITGNEAPLVGGGIYCGYSNPTVTNNTITGNEATEYGGGIYCDQSNPVIDNNTISGNSANGVGGGILCYESNPAISNNMLTENSATKGGGISCHQSNPVIANNTISGNFVNNSGGGIMCEVSNPTISNNSVTENEAQYGGGIFCFESNPEISNNIISGNRAIDYGGAIFCDGSVPEISNCTIVRNSSQSCGALYFTGSSAARILNTIFWQNDDDLILDFSSTADVSYSNISDSRFSGQNGNISSDPLFMNLEAGDYRLNPDSPCVDTGNPSSEYDDPDGSRNDMGAFGGPGAAAWGEEIPMIPVPSKDDAAWENLGLYGGQIPSLAIDPVNSSKMFAASYGGDGLFVTTDGGTNWQTVEGFRNRECLHVAIDPQDNNRRWVAYSYFIARSDDGGASWSRWWLPNGRFANAIAIDPTDSNIIYVGAGGESGSSLNGTVFKTIDGGNTWQQCGFVADKIVTFMAINPSDPNELWALTGYNESGSVYKSIDGGDSWDKIESGYEFFKLVIHPDSPSIVYISGNFGVIKTTDSGISWEDVGITKACRALTVDPQDPNIMYAATPYPGGGNYLYKSLDGGDTWKEYAIGYNSFLCLVVNPQDSDILYGGDSNLGVFESLEGGATWIPINEGIKANIVYDSAVDPNDPDILLAGTQAGLFKRDPDSVWTQLTHEAVYYSIAYDPTNSNTIYVGQQYTLAKTTDYGNTWEETTVSPSSGVASIAVDPQDSNILYLGVFYVLGNKGEIYKSIDGGKNLSLKKVFDVPVNVVKIDPTDSQVVYAGTGMFYESSYEWQGGIYKSIDGGESWFGPLLTGVVVNSIQIDPSNPNVVYAGCGDGDGEYRGFYKSVDGGLNWENKEFVWSAVTETRINPERTTTLYAATFKQGVYISIDAGENWANIGLSDYQMFDLSIYEPALSTTAESSLRGSFAQGSSARFYAGTNSGMAGYTGSSVSGYIYDSTGSATVYPASVWLDVVTSQINASVFGTGTYLILIPPVGDNYTLYCSAEGYREAQVSGISVGSMSESYYDFHLQSLGESDDDGSEDDNVTPPVTGGGGGGGGCFIATSASGISTN